MKFFTKSLAFVSELTRVSDDPQVKIYYKVMKKTEVGNLNVIKKHVTLFSSYILKNESAIVNKSQNSLTDDKISLNDKVYLQLKKYITKENKDVMFSHMLLLLYLCKPSEDLKKKIIESTQTQSESQTSLVSTSVPEEVSEEGDFLNKYLKKFEAEFSDKEFTDPVSVAMNIMQSGLITDLLKGVTEGVEKGSLNPNALLNNVQNTFKELTGNNISSMLNGENTNNSSNDNLDLSGMINMVSSMVGNMQFPTTSTESTEGGEGGFNANILGSMTSLLPSLMNMTSNSNGLNLDELEEELHKFKTN